VKSENLTGFFYTIKLGHIFNVEKLIEIKVFSRNGLVWTRIENEEGFL